MKSKKILIAGLAIVAGISSVFGYAERAQGAYHFSDFEGRQPIHVYASASSTPQGMTPAEVKKAYHLPNTGGGGTIAIIDAYDDATIESDLGVFGKKFALPVCTSKNGCFEKHLMATSTNAKVPTNSLLETALDVEWAHAIAPSAKILLVEAKTLSGQNLINAVDYAASRPDVVAVSMSWGGAEFEDEKTYDSHFVSKSGAVFFAASGDNGAGASWPAASSNVVGVGGTTLELSKSGAFVSESAWSGSGGGVSAYETEPNYQSAYSIPKANKMRAIPDVAYDADPRTGFPIYQTTGKAKTGAWYLVGGTSAGAPQWAAIESLGKSVALAKLYADKASTGTLQYFRDITSGANGTCSYYCDARKRYDYVTGLGSPLTVKF